MLGTALARTDDGGLNSVLSVALPAGGVAPGGCLNVALAFAVDQTGPFAFAYNVEDDLKPATTPTTTGTSTPTATATATGADTPVPAGTAAAPPALAGMITPTGVTATTTTTTVTTVTHAKQMIHPKTARRVRYRHKRTRRATAGRHATTTVTTKSSRR